MRRSRNCSFELTSEGYVRATIDELADMTLEDAREAVEITAELGAGRRIPVLVDTRRIRSQSREARAYFGGDRVGEVCAAVAILVGSPVSRIIGNFFLDRTFQTTTNRLFTDERAAVQWLLRGPP